MPQAVPSSAPKPLRSYGRTRGRKLRESGQTLVDTLLPNITFNPEAPLPAQPNTWLEIGCGAGEHAAFQAQENPNVHYIACEPYINGLSRLLQTIDAQGLDNIRIYGGDARDVLAKLEPASLARVFILFPDPWPKARHHKRRLIQQDFLSLLASKMKTGARLRIATDHVDYLGWILAHMLACPQFEWQATGHSNWSALPNDAIETRYQQKAAREGRVSSYLDFLRV